MDILKRKSKEEKEDSKLKRPKRMKQLLLAAAAALAAVIAIGGAVLALRGRETLRVDDTVYIVVNGEKIIFDGGVDLIRRDGKTTLRHQKKISDLDEAVIVDEAINGYIFEGALSINRTSELKIRKTEHFSKLSRQNGTVQLSYRGKETSNLDGFLYDNKNTYIFLEPVTLTVEETTYQLQPMTAVEVSYQQYVQIYGPGLTPEYIEYTGASAKAEFADGKSVNLSSDRFYQKNGEWRLLFLPLENLKSWTTD